jgi:hypothetical protein
MFIGGVDDTGDKFLIAEGVRFEVLFLYFQQYRHELPLQGRKVSKEERKQG